jgi:diketogulonate reductase-like aldo/keto reductase
MSEQPHVVLNTGARMPLVGLGTWCVKGGVLQAVLVGVSGWGLLRSS